MFDPKSLDGIADDLSAMYANAEVTLLGTIAKAVAKGKGEPAYAVNQLREVQRVRALVWQQAAALTATGPQLAQKAVLKGGDLGIAGAKAELAGLGFQSTGSINTRAIGALATETADTVRAANAAILRQAPDAYRAAVRELVGLEMSGAGNSRRTQQAVLDRLAAQGVTTFTDRAGRRWSMSSYVEMAVRTASHRAAMTGHTDQLIADGHDLVVVSAHPNPAPMCAPYERQVLSLSGNTSGTVTVPSSTSADTSITVTVKASLATARDAGLHHPNCGHSLRLYIPGATDTTPTEGDPDGYRDTQRQRALERRIRKWKKRKAVAMDPQAAAYAQKHVKAAQADMRAHLDATGLARRNYREQLRAGDAAAGASARAQAAALPAIPKPILAPPKPPKPHPRELAAEELVTLKATATKKIVKAKKPLSGNLMPAHADRLAADYYQRKAVDPTILPGNAEARAFQLIDALRDLDDAPDSTQAKAAASQAKMDLKAVIEAETKLWAAVYAKHGQTYNAWTDEARQWSDDIAGWLKSGASYKADLAALEEAIAASHKKATTAAKTAATKSGKKPAVVDGIPYTLDADTAGALKALKDPRTADALEAPKSAGLDLTDAEAADLLPWVPPAHAARAWQAYKAADGATPPSKMVVLKYGEEVPSPAATPAPTAATTAAPDTDTPEPSQAATGAKGPEYGTELRQLVVWKAMKQWADYDPLLAEVAKKHGMTGPEYNSQVINPLLGETYGHLHPDLFSPAGQAAMKAAAEIEEKVNKGLITPEQAKKAAVDAKYAAELAAQEAAKKAELAKAAAAKAAEEAAAKQAKAAEAFAARRKITDTERADPDLELLANYYVGAYWGSYDDLLGTFAGRHGFSRADANLKVQLRAAELYEPGMKVGQVGAFAKHRDAARTKLSDAADSKGPLEDAATPTGAADDILAAVHQANGVPALKGTATAYRRAEAKVAKLADPLSLRSMQAQAEKYALGWKIREAVDPAATQTAIEELAEDLLVAINAAKEGSPGTVAAWKRKATELKGELRGALMTSNVPSASGAARGLIEEKATGIGSKASPVKFAKGDIGRRWAAERWWNLPDDFMREHYRAISAYTSSTYGPINTAERVHKGKKPYDQGLLDNLDTAIEASPRVTEWIYVTRGTGLDTWDLSPGADVSQIVGKDFTDFGYMSTSVNTRPAFEGKPAIVHLDLPPGTKGVYVDGEVGQSRSTVISSVPGEMELILGRQTRYRVDRVERRDGKWHVYATVLEQHV